MIIVNNYENLHSETKSSCWLRYWTEFCVEVYRLLHADDFFCVFFMKIHEFHMNCYNIIREWDLNNFSNNYESIENKGNLQARQKI